MHSVQAGATIPDPDATDVMTLNKTKRQPPWSFHSQRKETTLEVKYSLPESFKAMEKNKQDMGRWGSGMGGRELSDAGW